ncbi:MAG TPA: tetratricopeptide repeat protein, partial [Gemmatimonadales bacterium]
DRLIEGERRGMETQGLEVAWHCIRSGREEEAAPYLLKGARQAIQRGAAQEAERGLSTGLGILRDDSLIEGLLLLAEALQEQGQWLESLVALEQCPPLAKTEDKSRMFVFKSLARRFLGHYESEDSFPTISQLISVSVSALSERTRARALLSGALIASGTKCDRSIKALLKASEHFAIQGQADIRNDITLARALLFALSSDAERSKATLAPAVAELRAKPGGMITGALLNAMGAVQCALGSYESALPDFEAAHNIAISLGNESLMCATAGNASLCCARLGRYRDQVAWGEKAVRRMFSSYTGFRELMCCYYRAHGYAMLGQFDAAVDAINTHETRIPSSIVAWQRQAWMLFKADVYQLARRNQQAVLIGRRAVREEYTELLAASTAGPFARWLALTASPDERGSTLERLEELAGRLAEFDAIDQVEILCALSLCRGQYRAARRDRLHIARRSLAERLVNFPPAVSTQLQLLGVLGGPAPSAPQ